MPADPATGRAASATGKGMPATPAQPADPLKRLPAGVSLLAFGATWCGPWSLLQPVLDELEASGTPVRRVDIDTWPHHAETYRVISVPTFVSLRDGKETRRRIGATSLADLQVLTRTRR